MRALIGRVLWWFIKGVPPSVPPRPGWRPLPSTRAHKVRLHEVWPNDEDRARAMDRRAGRTDDLDRGVGE